MATGGLIRMPAFDKSGSPIRKHREGCDAEPGCGCELKFVEKVLMPNPNVLMWQVDRLDPLPNGEPAPGMLERPELSPEQRRREAVEFYNLISGGLKVFEDLGQPISPTLRSMGIETTATTVDEFMPPLEIENTATPAPAEPEPAKAESAEGTPLESETPAEPEPGRPKFEDAF